MGRAATAARARSYVEQMRNRKLLCWTALIGAATTAALAAVQTATGSPATAAARSTAGLDVQAAAHSPLSSRQLWATVDVCDPHDRPDTIGIRGSMPGDGNPKDELYMRFRVQYLDPASKQWLYVKQRADSGMLKVGPADVTRQAGRDFQFTVAGRPSFTLRGIVDFQWKRGSRVLLGATRVTGAGDKNVARADPKGYSAATCTLP